MPSGAPSGGISSGPKWEDLYKAAILELDNTKVPKRIAEARSAMRDRAVEMLPDPASDERRTLKDALRNLDLLETVTARDESA